jgi:ABC-2 type transport system permease protein
MKFGYLALECRRALRNPRYLIFTVGMPTILFFIYVNIFPGTLEDSDVPFAAYLVPTLAALGAFFAAVASTAQTAVERATGWQRQLRLTPLSTVTYLTTKVVIAMLVSITPIVVICLLGRLVKDVQFAAADWTQIVLGTWLATLPFALLGLVVGQFVSAQNLPTAVNGILTLSSLLGGLLIPIAIFPDWMRTMAKVLPTYWIGEIGRGPLFGNTEFGMAVIVLAAWSVVAAALVAWRYQRATERVS